MAPKPRPTGTKDKQASSFKAIDNFLEKSNVNPDQIVKTKHIDNQLKQLKEKYFDSHSAQTLLHNT